MTRAAAAPALRIPIGTAAPVSQPDMSPNRRRDRASDRGARAACATATGCRQVVALLRKSGAAAAARCAAPTSVPFATHLRRSGGVHRTARGRRGRPCRVLYRASRQGRARLRPRAGDSSCLRCNPRLPISLRCSMIRRLRCRSRRASSRALSSSWWSLRREILSVASIHLDFRSAFRGRRCSGDGKLVQPREGRGCGRGCRTRVRRPGAAWETRHGAAGTASNCVKCSLRDFDLFLALAAGAIHVECRAGGSCSASARGSVRSGSGQHDRAPPAQRVGTGPPQFGTAGGARVRGAAGVRSGRSGR